MSEIKLEQVPVISHKLKEIGSEVTKRIESLNIEKQVATEDTRKSLKEMRTSLNSELKAFEDQRKDIGKAINNPYKAFEAEYKTQVSEKYKSAIDLLKDKIASVENDLKAKKKEVVEIYFNELISSENIDFVSFDKLGLDINLSTTEKKYKEQVNEFIERVTGDISLIKTLEHEVEIMAEYKVCLNTTKAIKDVQDRKEREKTELKRKQIQELNRRKLEFERVGMNLDTETNVFAFNTEIYISTEAVKELSKDEFRDKIVEFEEIIKDIKPVTTPEKEPVISSFSNPVKVEAPKVETKEDIVNASFQVSSTYSKLKALGQYMKDNGITYKNI